MFASWVVSLGFWSVLRASICASHEEYAIYGNCTEGLRTVKYFAKPHQDCTPEADRTISCGTFCFPFFPFVLWKIIIPLECEDAEFLPTYSECIDGKRTVTWLTKSDCTGSKTSSQESCCLLSLSLHFFDFFCSFS